MSERRIIDGFIYERTANGEIVPVGPVEAAPITMGTPDPSYGAQQQITANKAAASNYDPAMAAAELAAKQAQASAAQRQAGTQASKESREVTKFQQEQQGGANTLGLLRQGIDNLDKIYEDSFAGKGFQSIGESYAPAGLRPANEQLNTAANSLSSTVARALQLTGQQFNTPAEAQMFIGGMLPKNDDPDEVIVDKMIRLKNIYENAAKNVAVGSGGEYRPRYDTATGALFEEQAPPQENAIGQTVGGADATQQRIYAAGEGQTSYEGGAYSTDEDKAVGAKMQQIFDQGGGIREINAVLGDNPFRPGTPEFNKLVEALEYRDQGGQGAKILAPQTGVKEQSWLGWMADNPVGAAVVGAGNVGSFGLLDEAAEAAGIDGVQQTKEYLRDQYGVASALGEVGGGVGTFLGAGRLALKAAPKLGAGGSAVAGDIGAGAAFGAGEDNQGRLRGALLGGGAALVGEGLGRMIPKAAGRAVAPTGGSMKPLYNEGVRPTLGQRVADKGVLGGAINKVEEGMQSLPIVGSMVTGARQGARDQFETGAFNRSLREIGTELPPEAPYGPEAFKYAGQAFDDAYGNARAGMQFAPDSQFSKEFGELQREVKEGGLLDSESINQFGKTIQTTVGSRMRQGGMSGDVYKKTVSDLGKKISQTTKPELRQALQEFRGIMDDAARRNSDPQAVAAMDAADRGYSQYKPLTQAQERAGSDAGRFTPKSLEATERMGMKKTRAYREGNTVLGDYINASKGLNDTLPNSGTPDRLMNSGGLAAMGGAAFFDPTVAAVMAGSTLPYAPGIRNLQALMMAPRKSPMLNEAGQQIYDSSRYLGPLGAASTVPLLTQ